MELKVDILGETTPYLGSNSPLQLFVQTQPGPPGRRFLLADRGFGVMGHYQHVYCLAGAKPQFSRADGGVRNSFVDCPVARAIRIYR